MKYVVQNVSNKISKIDNDIDKLIQDTQLGHDIREPLEWIPYDRFYDI